MRLFSSFRFQVFASLFVLIFPFSVRAQQTATLHGVVTDPSGAAVAGAKVNLLAGVHPLAERKTNVQGRYEFSGLNAGDFQVVASAPGFTTATTPTGLSQGESRELDLHLKLSALEQQVVVSASLGGALESQAGSTVTVLTSQQMEDQGAQSLYDALREIPGVAINQTDGRGGVTSAFIRGGNSNYNLVMLDGIPLNQFGGGSSFDFAPFLVDGIEQVEVLRGPQSALYGSEAIAGVVNFASRKGDAAPEFDLLGEGGSHGTYRLAGGASGLARGLGWSFSLARLQTNGVVPNDDFENQSSYLSLDYPHSLRRQFHFHFFGDANDAGTPGPFGSNPDGLFTGIDTVSRDKQNLFGYQGGYEERFSSRFRQVTTVSVADNRGFFISPFGDSFDNNVRTVVNTQSEITVSHSDFLAQGFEFNRERERNTFIVNQNNTPFDLPRTSLAYFFENRWSPASRWFISTGLRVDHFHTGALPPDAFGVHPAIPASTLVKVDPRISVAYLIHQSAGRGLADTTRLHSSFGTGIREPNGFELAFTNNPNLKPERTTSFDLGLEQRLFESRAVFDLTYFYNRFTDQIVETGNLPIVTSFISENIANSRAQGVETSFRVRPFRSLEVAGEYTHLASQILALNGATLAQPPFQVGQPLIRRPDNSGGYDITWTHHALMLNLNSYVRGSVLDVEPNLGLSACPGLPCLFRNKGYVLSNAGFTYRLPRGTEIYGRINNFLNQKYEEAFGFPSLHLNFLTGVKFRFPAK